MNKIWKPKNLNQTPQTLDVSSVLNRLNDWSDLNKLNQELS